MSSRIISIICHPFAQISFAAGILFCSFYGYRKIHQPIPVTMYQDGKQIGSIEYISLWKLYKMNHSVIKSGQIMVIEKVTTYPLPFRKYTLIIDNEMGKNYYINHPFLQIQQQKIIKKLEN